MIKEYIEKIVENGKPEDMEELSDILEEAIYELKEYDKDVFCDYKMKLYELANGKVLTKKMAEDWVENMKPASKWNYDTTSAVRVKYGLADIDEISFFVVMNMLYSDMKNVLGDGETEESLTHYVQATKDWLKDDDIGADKLYNYWKYVAR